MGISNNVCLAKIDNLPGKDACNKIGSIKPLGCQATNIIPPSCGMFSLSTMSNSLNHVDIKERLNLRNILYVMPIFGCPGPSGSLSHAIIACQSISFITSPPASSRKLDFNSTFRIRIYLIFSLINK